MKRKPSLTAKVCVGVLACGMLLAFIGNVMLNQGPGRLETIGGLWHGVGLLVSLAGLIGLLIHSLVRRRAWPMRVAQTIITNVPHSTGRQAPLAGINPALEARIAQGRRRQPGRPLDPLLAVGVVVLIVGLAGLFGTLILLFFTITRASRFPMRYDWADLLYFIGLRTYTIASLATANIALGILLLCQARVRGEKRRSAAPSDLQDEATAVGEGNGPESSDRQ